MSSHLLLRQVDELKTSKPSYVMWSVEPADTVVFFIHGFLGSALSTWRQFDSLAPEDPWFRRADLVFFGYRSVVRQTFISAAEILESCVLLIQNSATIMNSSVFVKGFHRAGDHRYRNVMFIAHSLGAIIARQLLLAAEERKCPWIDDVRFVLFAPAHNGATDVSKLPASIARMAGPLSAAFSTLIMWKAQTLSEVKEDSNTLNKLKELTEKALAQRRAKSLSLHHLIAAKVLFGSDEDVVQAAPFCDDPSLVRVDGKGHQNVCKPTPDYRDPVRACAIDRRVDG